MRKFWSKKRGAGISTPFAHQIKRDNTWVTLWLVLFVVLLSYYAPKLPLERLDNVVYDVQQRLQPDFVNNTEPPIALVIIDDQSLTALGHWPWRRKVYADLLMQLKQAKVVGIDLLFTSPNPAYPNDDQLLAEAIKNHGNVILPVYIDKTNQLIEPTPPLLEVATGLGFINIQPDADGVVRHIRLLRDLEQSIDSRMSRQLSSKQTAAHFSVAMVGATDDAEQLRNLDAHYKTPHLIPFVGPFGSFPTYPFSKVLNGDYPPDTFKNKYVIIGAWSSGLGDYYPTPFSSTENTSMSGVEILANATNNILKNHWFHKTPSWVQAIANILPVLFICIGLRQFSPRVAFFGTSLVVIALFVGNWILLHIFRVWLPISSALVGSLIAYPLWYWRSQETVLRYVDKQLSDLRQHNPGLSQALNISQVQFTLPARLNHLYKSIELLREAEQRREETLRFISHDMRAPQNSILALVEMQRHKNNLGPEQEQFYRRLEQYASNTLVLVDDFLDLARIESSAFELAPIVLNDLINQAMDEVWPNAAKKDIKLKYQETDELVWIQGHVAFLHRAFINLLDNAIKYSPPYTTVFCSLSTHKDLATIQIQDQGWGIPKEELPNIFNAFKRFHTGHTDNPKGTGLGLAFVNTVIARHQGRIEVESVENQGTVFSIHLPTID